MALTITIYLDSPNDIADFFPVLLTAATKLKDELEALKEEVQEDTLARDIATFELNVRSIARIQYSSSQLKTLKELGAKALRKIVETLAEVGLGLRKDS
jgi:DNA-directed RNA polymerase alpha subunit